MGIDLTGTNANAVSLVLVALIVGVFGFAGPIIVQRSANKQREKERREDKADRAALIESTNKAATTLVESNKKVAAAAIEAGDRTLGTLQEIKLTGEATHTIVNSEKSKMVVRLAKQARLIARLMPDDAEAQTIASEAEKEEAALSKQARELPGGGTVAE